MKELTLMSSEGTYGLKRASTLDIVYWPKIPQLALSTERGRQFVVRGGEDCSRFLTALIKLMATEK